MPDTAPENWSLKLSSELRDKLIDKREKFGYFLVTASVGVIVFVFKDLNNKDGVLRQDFDQIRDRVLWGCGMLLTAAILALYLIYERHRQYYRWLASQDHPERAEAMNKKMDWVDRVMSVASLLLPVAFMAGMILLVVAYARAL